MLANILKKQGSNWILFNSNFFGPIGPKKILSNKSSSAWEKSKDEKSKLLEELTQRLERLRPDKMMERQANEAENLNKSLQYRAFPRQFYSI